MDSRLPGEIWNAIIRAQRVTADLEDRIITPKDPFRGEMEDLVGDGRDIACNVSTSEVSISTVMTVPWMCLDMKFNLASKIYIIHYPEMMLLIQQY